MLKNSKSIAASVLVGSDKMSHFTSKVIASIFEWGITGNQLHSTSKSVMAR